ncbi:hypothetical protein SK066_18635 [Paenibacillus hunanensis]|uniref:hypothetical protein n=1 Tax=Paenibacillus hunanensis TaxID=539262 RepID=UPI002A6B0A40|nr:hypothetical protein [Paenibacillus hunanensis]WPP40591.1 hypothetical protein SK066_18635 [Paenibacillus hunanensis]
MNRHPMQGNDDTINRHDTKRRPADDARNDTAADRADTDAAWMKMQALLANEAPHPNWQQWEEYQPTVSDLSAPEPTPISNVKGLNAMNHQSSHTPQQTNTKTKSRRFGSKARKWTAGIAACVVAGTVLATPFGNNALASLLNEFRMQELTAINDNGINNMIDQYHEKGVTTEDMNRFGTFSSTTGAYVGEQTASQAISKLGYKALSASALKQFEDRVYVSSSQTETYKLNTDAVNSAITRLGGTTLLPEEMNGKLITINQPESIRYQMIVSDSDSNPARIWASLEQMGVPKVTFDEGVDPTRLLETLADLPLVPQDVKSMLEKQKVLNGELPLPVMSNQPSKLVKVNDIPVVIEEYPYIPEHNDYAIYNAYWIKDGEYFRLEGSDKVFANTDAIIAKVKELTAS